MRWRTACGLVALTSLALGCGRSDRGTGGSVSHGAAAVAGRGGSDSGAGGGSGTGGTSSGSAGRGVGGTSGSGSSGGGAGGSGGTGGGNSGTGGSVDEGGAAGSGETPTREPGECSLWPDPALAAPSVFTLGGVTARASEHDCAYELGEPVALPVTSDAATRLLFHYDVNGDGVDDLFVGPSLGDAAASVPVRLLLSKLDGGNLSFGLSDCELPWEVANGAYFVRDLDDDGFPDVVIGTRNGVRVMMSRSGGLVTTVEYEFPDSENGWAGFMDAAVGDFDGDGANDLALGFDRTSDGLSKMEVGAMIFSDVAEATSTTTPAWRDVLDWGIDVIGDGIGWPLGYLAPLDGGKSLFSPIYGSNALGWLYSGGQVTGVPVSGSVSWSTRPTFVQRLVIDGAENVLVGLEEQLTAFDPHAVTAATRTLATAFPHRLDHEQGGGKRTRSYYVIDIDGDGTDELVEADREVDPFADNPVARVVMHAGDGHGWFEQEVTTTLDLPAHWDPGSESPFLTVGAMNGRLLVARLDASAPLSVIALGCQ